MRESRVWAFLFVFTAFAAAVGAQQGTSAIRGRALDEQGGFLPGVPIVVTHEESGIFRETVTGPDGTYSIQNLVPGPYRVTAEITGFKKLTRDHIALTAGLTQTLDLALEVGTVAESLTVTGQAPQVDLTSSAVVGNISIGELKAMPSLSHGVMSYLQVVPGVVYLPTYKPSTDGLTINGQSLGVHYYVDGGPNYSAVFSGSVGNRVMTPSEIVQEIVAVTTQLPAEYGGRTGGVINAITKQGTNAWRGGVHGYFNNTALTAADYFVNLNNQAEPAVKRNQGNFTHGRADRPQPDLLLRAPRVLGPGTVQLGVVSAESRAELHVGGDAQSVELVRARRPADQRQQHVCGAVSRAQGQVLPGSELPRRLRRQRHRPGRRDRRVAQ